MEMHECIVFRFYLGQSALSLRHSKSVNALSKSKEWMR